MTTETSKQVNVNWNKIRQNLNNLTNFKFQDTRKISTYSVKKKPGYEIVYKGKVKVVRKAESYPMVSENEPISTATLENPQISFICASRAPLDNTLLQFTSVDSDANRLKNNSQEKLNENLLEALSDIKTNKLTMNCTLKRKFIKDEEQGVLYYSQELDKQYKLYCRSWDKEVKNNLLVFLFKLGEFTCKFNCYRRFCEELEKFALNELYVRFHKISEKIYHVWKPKSEFELLKIGRFSFYWFEALYHRDIEHFRDRLH